MRKITLKRIYCTKFTREEFNNALTKDYRIIRENPCTDIITIFNEEYMDSKEFDYILNLIKNYTFHSMAVKREDVKDLPIVFTYPPFIIEPILISEILGYYFYKMNQLFDLEKLMNYKNFEDLEYYRKRAISLYKILKDEDVEEHTFYIEILKFR